MDFEIANEQQQKTVIENTLEIDFGISCIYPQIPGIQPYHNNAVWPFVQSFWAIASAKAGNEKSALESIAATSAIPGTLTGSHYIKFVLANHEFQESKFNKVTNYTTLETPVVSYSCGILSWNPVEGVKFYSILKNGKAIQQTTKTSLKVDPTDFAEYQVLTVDANNISSFASEPVVVVIKEFVQN
jgi:hypothetical protein